jgi:hypothetical protein
MACHILSRQVRVVFLLSFVLGLIPFRRSGLEWRSQLSYIHSTSKLLTVLSLRSPNVHSTLCLSYCLDFRCCDLLTAICNAIAVYYIEGLASSRKPGVPAIRGEIIESLLSRFRCAPPTCALNDSDTPSDAPFLTSNETLYQILLPRYPFPPPTVSQTLDRVLFSSSWRPGKTFAL